MKKHKLKPRYIFLIVSLVTIFAGYAAYAVIAGQTYRMVDYTGISPVDMSTVSAVSSNEKIVRVKSVWQERDKDSFNLLYAEVESVGSGSCTVSLSFYSPEDRGMTTYRSELYVTATGMIYDFTCDSFTALSLALPVELLTLLIITVVLSLSFAERLRKGEFSYSMVVMGGVILFLALTIVVLAIEWLGSGINDWISVKLVFTQLLYSASSFVRLMAVPVAVIAAAIGLSNIRLFFKEGFHWQNALGVFLGAALLAGMLALRSSSSAFDTDSDALFFFMMVAHTVMSFLLCYFECMLLSTIFCAVAATRYKPPHNMDYIIILGCALNSDGTPTPLLRGRVERALAFENEQFADTGKHAKFVPSGGQGSDEVISEAESMKRCLMELGIPEERIIKEDRSVNTYRNMECSKRVIEQDAESFDNVNIAFSTTNYHVFRGYTLAKKVDMKVKGLSAKTKLYFFPNAFVREFIGLLWEQRRRHLLFAAFLIASAVSLFLIIVF